MPAYMAAVASDLAKRLLYSKETTECASVYLISAHLRQVILNVLRGMACWEHVTCLFLVSNS